MSWVPGGGGGGGGGDPLALKIAALLAEIAALGPAAQATARASIGAAAAGGGIALLTKTILSGVVGAGVSVDQNVPDVPNQALIVSAFVRRTAGKAASVAVLFYERDSFAADITGPSGGAWNPHGVMGDAFGGVDLEDIDSPGVSEWTAGPQANGVGWAPANIYDRDGSGEWHVRFSNQDFVEPGEFELRVLYYAAPLSLL